MNTIYIAAICIGLVGLFYLNAEHTVTGKKRHFAWRLLMAILLFGGVVGLGIKVVQMTHESDNILKHTQYIYTLNEETEAIRYPDTCNTNNMTCTILDETFHVDRIKHVTPTEKDSE